MRLNKPVLLNPLHITKPIHISIRVYLVVRRADDQLAWLPFPLLVHGNCFSVGDNVPHGGHPGGVGQVEAEDEGARDDAPSACARHIVFVCVCVFLCYVWI